MTNKRIETITNHFSNSWQLCERMATVVKSIDKKFSSKYQQFYYFYCILLVLVQQFN